MLELAAAAAALLELAAAADDFEAAADFELTEATLAEETEADDACS